MQRKSTYLSGEIFSAYDVAVHISNLPVRTLVEQAWAHRNAVDRCERKKDSKNMTNIVQLIEGSYKPLPVKRVEIPKPDGGKRPLGIPTVTDRVIQQAIARVLTPVFDPGFSDAYANWTKLGSFHELPLEKTWRIHTRMDGLLRIIRVLPANT